LTTGRADKSMQPDPLIQETLRRLYSRRFSAEDRQRMSAVWQVLVRDFFAARIASTATVVDVGAGGCHFINAVHAKRRIAIDANPDLGHHAAPGVETVISDDLSLGALQDEVADCVFVSNFLEHLTDFLEVLRLLTAIHRVLKPGGAVHVLTPNFRLVPRQYFDFIDHRVILTDASLVEALEVTRFEVKELRRRFLPFTSKSALPSWPWLVGLYLRLPPAQWLLGGQSYVRATKLAS
jgi:SAM-dependent methyltransferase